MLLVDFISQVRLYSYSGFLKGPCHVTHSVRWRVLPHSAAAPSVIIPP